MDLTTTLWGWGFDCPSAIFCLSSPYYYWSGMWLDLPSFESLLDSSQSLAVLIALARERV
jgi:hypothetical protein